MKFFTKKSLGQNFLVDNKVLNKIIETGDVEKEDIVIEVGPGNGALTEKIFAKKPKKIIVVEKDNRLNVILKKKFTNNIKIVNQDMMDFSYDDYQKNTIIIFGNLPYNISTQILAKWIKIKNIDNFCKRLVLMFQKEVADRIIAKTNTKHFGRLSILSNWRMEVKKIIDIEPESFKPSPKVKSTLLIFVPKRKFFEFKDPKNLEHITNVFFTQKRKMIKKPLKLLFENYEEISKKLNIDLNMRPQNLENVTYYEICKYYESLLSK